MNDFLKPFIIASIVVFAIMLALYLIQLKTKKADVVDVAWSFNFTWIAIIYYYLGVGAEPRKLLLAIIVGAWSIRLGSYLWTRVMSHKGEEGRYVALREEWAGQVNYKFFTFFMFQAIINMVLSIPYLFIIYNKDASLSTLEIIGASITVISVIGEGLSDYQLKLFKKDPANKGKVCQYGLWNYSRHPNYFFQFMIWVGIGLMSTASGPHGLFGWISAALILFFLTKVTGIPMTEELAVKNKGEAYINYQKTTSVFIPWIKKSLK